MVDTIYSISHYCVAIDCTYILFYETMDIKNVNWFDKYHNYNMNLLAIEDLANNQTRQLLPLWCKVYHTTIQTLKLNLFITIHLEFVQKLVKDVFL